MTAWNEYQVGSKRINAKYRLSKIIVNELGLVTNEFFGCSGRVRRAMPDKPSYQVYANGLSDHLTQLNGGDFKNTEWLYDLHWYEDGAEPYTTLCLPLVMECEWNPRRKGDPKVPFSGIKYDFQKLLVSNAELRLMIFKVKKLSDLDELDSYFKSNIKNYKHLETGAKFLFVAFYDKDKTFYYKEVFK